MGIAPVSHAATPFYSTDFEGGAGPEWTGASLFTVPSAPACTSAEFCGTTIYGELSNGAIELTLAGLPTHTAVMLSFDLFVYRSMDGNSPHCACGPDVITMTVDGGTAMSSTFRPLGDAADPATMAYPDALGAGSHPPCNEAYECKTLGIFYSGIEMNAVWRFPNAHHGMVLAHSDPTLTVRWEGSGMQDVSDEAWGVDNVEVHLEGAPVPVPELGAWALAATGIAGVGAMAVAFRRRGA